MMAKIILDGKEYDTESMSEKALAQAQALQYVNNQLLELEMRSAAYQTARVGYARSLKQVLENGEEEGKGEDSAKITIPDDLTFD
jgi:hypothetical protein